MFSLPAQKYKQFFFYLFIVVAGSPPNYNDNMYLYIYYSLYFLLRCLYAHLLGKSVAKE